MHTLKKSTVSLGLACALCGCASAPPRPIGAVAPMVGGGFQSTVSGPDKASASKTFTHDADVTCRKGPPPSSLPWAAAPEPGRFTLVSQTAKDKEGKKIKSDDSKLDAGIAVGLRYMGLESKDSVELVSVFKCD